MLSIPKSVYANLTDILTRFGAKGIAYDIVFQNADDEEQSFIDALKRHPNTVIATTQPDGVVCLPHPDTSLTCSGTPRSVYDAIPWGLIHINDIESRPIGYDISQIPELHWKFSGKHIRINDTLIPTLPLALLAQSPTHRSRELFQFLKSVQESGTDRSILNPYFGPPNSYITIPLIRILEEPELYRDIIRDAYVFVGES